MEPRSLQISSILGLISVAVLSFSYTRRGTSENEPLVPALFIFGDSLADPGNNNYLISLAKANHPPYGRQFDTHEATGRFTNGRTAMDFLGEFSVTSCSGRTGIATGATVHGSGSNDFVNGYYFLIPTSPPGISLKDFIQLLVSTASRQLKALYELGARKIGIAGLAPLGCCPSQITKYNLTSGGCVEFLNEVSKQFNTGLKKMLTELREELKDLHIVYSNLYDPILDAINNPAKYGFNFTHAACCGVGKLHGKFICMPYSRPCDDPQHHIFFDYYHPTDTMYNLIFKSVYFNGPPLSEPYSGQYLANLHI